MWKRWTVVFLGLSLAMASFRPAHTEEAPFPRPTNFVTLRARYPLDEAAEAMLRRNGFVVLDSVTTTDLPRAYDRHVDADLPSFVTTDALLHLWYELHRHLLREAEQRSFYPRLCEVVTALGQANATLRKQKTDDLSQSALRQAAVTLAVAERLLLESATAPSDLRSEVEVWVEKVLAHSEAAPYPGEDFTQYEVRGHYADRPDLSRYFRGSLWLSRRFMSVEPAPSSPPYEGEAGGGADAPLRQAVALAAVVRAAPEARERLRGLQAARQFLTGRPNAISVEQVVSALDRALGQGWSLPQALQPSALAALRQELARPDYPASPVFTRPTLPEIPFPGKIMSLLPDFAIPDSVLFQNTVNPAIPNRSLPTGLEVAAALGSDVARQQIQSTDPQADQVLAIVDHHRPLVRDEGQSVYDGWLHTLSTLFVTDPRAPDFMQGDAWRCEKLNTGLSSWAQLRHAYILYGSQSYATTGDGEISLISLVEPIPAFYRALGGLAECTRSVLGRVSALSGDSDRLLRAFEEKCRELETYAEAELQGRLTPEQAQRIAEFGPWIKQFPFTSAPLVADVATGMSDEVLHAATGPFNPLLVIPDRGQGVAYVGWVMSYYEFRRPALERLTDAEWQALHQNTYWRPDRPEWAREFVCGGGGEEWQSRAPLREAERLLARKQVDDALALLRRTVAENPDTPLATEAQCRLGQLLLAQGDYKAAEEELSPCRRMVGGDAWHIARRLLEQARGRQKRLQREASRQEPDELKEARTALESLKEPSLTSLQRYRLEKKIASLLLLSGFRTHPQSLELLKEAAAACRTSTIREALNYSALVRQRYLSDYGTLSQDPSALIEECLRFARTAESAPLRAAALALAVRGGVHGDNPRQALDLLRPYLKRDIFQPKNSPALTLLKEASGEGGLDLYTDPQDVFMGAVDSLRSRLILESYYAGDFEAMIEYRRTLPAEAGNREGEDFERLYAAFPDFSRQPLRLFAQAEGLEEQSLPKAAADRFFEVYQKYPRCKLAPFALWQAQWSYRRAGETRRAEEVEGLLDRRFPDTYPGLLVRTRAAFARGDEAQTRRLLEWCGQARERQPDYFYRLLLHGGVEDVQWELERHDRLKKALQPLAEAAGRPELLKEIPLRGDVAKVAEKFAAALPDRAAEVYLALMPLAPALRSRFLERFPDHPEAVNVRWEMPRSTFFPQCLQGFVPFLNGEPGTRGFQEVFEAFARAMGQNDLALLRERVKHVRGAFSGTRAAQAADCLLARTLVQTSRPEEALKVLREVLPHLAAEDPLREEAQNLSRRAELEVWAKHQPEWTPVWSRAGQPRKDFYFDRYRSIAAPVVAHGLLLVPVSRGIPLDGPAALDEAQAAENRDGLVALDEVQGTERWAARIGPVSSLSTDAAGRLFCGTDTSTLVALDAATGQVLYERIFDFNRCWPTYAVDAGGTLVVCSQAGVVAGLRPATGETLWQKEWMPVKGMSAVIGNRVFLATTDGRVRALDAASGEVLWARLYQPEQPERLYQPILVAQPLSVGEGLLLVCAQNLELLDARDGRLLRQLASQGKGEFPAAVIMPGSGLVVGWDQDGQGTVVTLPDLEVRRPPLPRVRYQARGALQGRTLYMPGDEVQAVDLDTGAVFAWFGDSDSAGDWITLGRWVYVISIDGHVLALPFLPSPQAPLVSGVMGDTLGGPQ